MESTESREVAPRAPDRSCGRTLQSRWISRKPASLAAAWNKTTQRQFPGDPIGAKPLSLSPPYWYGVDRPPERRRNRARM